LLELLLGNRAVLDAGFKRSRQVLSSTATFERSHSPAKIALLQRVEGEGALVLEIPGRASGGDVAGSDLFPGELGGADPQVHRRVEDRGGLLGERDPVLVCAEVRVNDSGPRRLLEQNLRSLLARLLLRQPLAG